MPSRRHFLALAAAAFAFAPAARAASPVVFATDGIAIHGTDPVAYFTQNMPVDGDAKYTVKWMGAMWRFSSKANMAAFEADPAAYAPQFGGYCAYAASKGAVATSVPEAWTIVDGKLYLNFSTGVRSIWQQDIAGNIARASANWPAILGQ